MRIRFSTMDVFIQPIIISFHFERKSYLPTLREWNREREHRLKHQMTKNYEHIFNTSHDFYFNFSTKSLLFFGPIHLRAQNCNSPDLKSFQPRLEKPFRRSFIPLELFSLRNVNGSVSQSPGHFVTQCVVNQLQVFQQKCIIKNCSLKLSHDKRNKMLRK